MPTTPRKVRILLKEGRAKVISRTPFVIQLLIATGENKQPIILGVDSGSKTVGLSATTEKEELYSAEAALRNDIVELLSERREIRRSRRNRKTRYRKHNPDKQNRPEGWLAPSIKHKIDSHLRIIKMVHGILPITKTIVEVAAFDIQKIQDPNINSIQYQQGPQFNFWNVREYVLYRDGHTCKGKTSCKNKILNVHHIESRLTGGNAPNNLITLCEDCHKSYHNGTLKLNLKRGKVLKDAVFMGVMRWNLYNQLKVMYSNVSLTYGYITKSTRIDNNLPKTHNVDAYCITKNTKSKLNDTTYQYKFVRRNNRSLHKVKLIKGGKRKNNKAPRLVKGYRLFDKVLYNKQECFIFARRESGYFDLRLLDGAKVHASAKCKDLKLLEFGKTLLVEKRDRPFLLA